jgi:mannose-1-phosphate guanylyltransferase/mannose-6-phosphate isomerase
MLEETIERIKPHIPLDNIRIITGESMTKHILNRIEDIDRKHILTEPFGRNTCLAIGLAAVHLAHQDENAVMTVLSSDHLIRPAEKLLELIEIGCSIASEEDCLITIGIMPTRPETGYGYIKLGELYRTEEGSNVYSVSAFTEKPKLTVAQEYYLSRKYLWNSGMFIWSTKTILREISEHQPEMGEALIEYARTVGTDKEEAARLELYENAAAISIDYAVLENASSVLTMKADIVWDDVGSWNSLERIQDKDDDNNVLIGETALLDTFETTVYNDSEGIIACIGVSDLVVVRSSDVTLVVHKTKTAEVKQLLATLSEDEDKRKYI